MSDIADEVAKGATSIAAQAIEAHRRGDMEAAKLLADQAAFALRLSRALNR